MRYFTVPETVILKNPITGEVGKAYNFYEFAQNTLLGEKRFGKSVKELRAAVRIGDVLRDKKPGDVIALESSDWDILKDVAEAPEGGYLPGIATQVIGYIEAVIGAAEKAPELVKSVVDAPTVKPVDAAA